MSKVNSRFQSNLITLFLKIMK